MSSDFTHPYISVGGRLRQAHLRALAKLSERVQEQGFTELTDAHYAIWRFEGPHGRRPTEIALATGLSKQAVNDLLGQLERWGYLERVPDPKDGRGRIVHLTERGHAARAAVIAAGRAVEADWRERVGEPEWTTFRAVLQRIALWDGEAGPAEAQAEPSQPSAAV